MSTSGAKSDERMQELWHESAARYWTHRPSRAVLSQASFWHGTHVAKSTSRFKQIICSLAALPMPFVSRLRSIYAFVELQVCSHCSFIQTKIPFDEDDIIRLYVDYREPSYNRERIQY
jgi:hypothetical protein